MNRPRYQLIEELISESRFSDLLELYHSDIKEIEDTRDILKAGDFCYSESINRAIATTASNYTAFILPLVLLDEHTETEASRSLLDNSDEENKVSNLKAMSKLSTANIRKVKGVLQAYVNSADVIIKALQSILKSLERERQVVYKQQ